jgi:hypothetical protein
MFAEEIDHMVTVSLGAMCTRIPSEGEFLQEALGFAQGLAENPISYLENWGLADKVDSEAFSLRMRNLGKHIHDIIEIPIENRGQTREEKYYR